MFDPEKIVRENVRRLTPYSCARDEYKGKKGIFMDANENPYGNLNRYPDPYQEELKEAVSELKGIPSDRIFLGNGSDEIIDLCFRTFCNPGSDKALTFSPTYGMYEVSASVNDVQIIKVPLDYDFQPDFDKTLPYLQDKRLKLILMCSPNNPTGNCLRRSEMLKIISGSDRIVLVDEAYIDFAEGPSLKEEIFSYPNLIVMQTFSKAFGMASVRVGMAFASPEIVGWLNKMKPPYNISTLNQKSVLKRLFRKDSYLRQVSRIKTERQRLSGELKRLGIVKKVFPSDANFILVSTVDAGMVYNKLLDRGIIVRNRSAAVSNCIRITVGTKKENDALLRALKNI